VLPQRISASNTSSQVRLGRLTLRCTAARFAPFRDGMIQSGMEVGAAESYDRLAELLETPS
jgi:hypothetical protein